MVNNKALAKGRSVIPAPLLINSQILAIPESVFFFICKIWIVVELTKYLCKGFNGKMDEMYLAQYLACSIYSVNNS